MVKALSRQVVFNGRVLEVGLEQHALPNGRQSSFEIIRHPGGAAALPILPDGRILLIRQFRPAIGAMIYEIPAGRLEPNESAQQCAGRELIEEVGYVAGALTPLAGFWSTVGFCDEYIHLFLATGLQKTSQALEPDEVIELCPMTLEDALSKVKSGVIADSKTQLAIFHYQQMLRDGAV